MRRTDLTSTLTTLKTTKLSHTCPIPLHNIQWTNKMSNGYFLVHWTNCILEYQMDFRRCSLGVLDSLDPMVDSNVQWTFECQMAMLAALSWALVTGDYDTA